MKNTLGTRISNLRKEKGLTQEELAEKLYVSRTAVSKWESGRGYPNIDSLKAISGFFSVTVDELLSPKTSEKEKKISGDLICSLLDLCMSLLFILPLFAERAENGVMPATLLTLGGYLRFIHIALTLAMIALGIAELALRECQHTIWMKNKYNLSLAAGVVVLLTFVVSLQPYAAVFAFILLAIKAIFMQKCR